MPKRKLNIAGAMLGQDLATVVCALIEAHVDPGDETKPAALEQTLLGADR